MISLEKNFWKKGIHFECQGSGKCCSSRGGYGYVYFTDSDRTRMAKVLGMTRATFTRQYCERTEGHYHLKSPDKECIFLFEKRCTAYDGRPEQCRTWPFWPENMNPKVWKKDLLSFCPGVGKGRLYTAKEIEKILATQSETSLEQ